VAGGVGGIQDQIVDGESGVLVDPHDLAAAGTAIDRLLAEPERAARMGHAAQQRVMDEFLQINRLLEYFEHIEELLEAERGT
jgi:trehalose synthase